MAFWPFERKEKALAPVPARGGWWPLVHESFTGAWQRNVTVKRDAVLAYHAVFSCMTLIASDISTLEVKIVRQDGDGIWNDVKAGPSHVLRRPNTYQNKSQFLESWVLSKLSHGNTYALKVRDGRGAVVQLHILDPVRVKPLISDDGQVFYEIQPDNLSGSKEVVTVPARDIIHDRYNCLFHPLIGLSPIYANGLAATQGLNIQNHSAAFFGNASMPGGILTAPGEIKAETAQRLKDHWETNYSGRSAGKIAVLGDGLAFEALATKAVDAQLLEQMKWTAEVVCGTFHVPPFKIGVGPEPSGQSVQASNLRYYTDSLKKLIEDAEDCLTEGLGMADGTRVEIDEHGLLRMDSMAQMEVLERAKSVLTLDERRKRLNAPAITGGDTVYLQQQDHSIEAIAARDRQLIAQANAPSAPPDAPVPEPSESEERAFVAETLLSMRKAMEDA
ncbi:MAG TPA: phage portal protein [Paracoccus sp.]|nr:phage portal protein [Paracoccus sp. (in: a-proteobacteria)]